MPRKILVVNWCLNWQPNYRAVDRKFTLQLMAAIIKVNNRDSGVEIA